MDATRVVDENAPPPGAGSPLRNPKRTLDGEKSCDKRLKSAHKAGLAERGNVQVAAEPVAEAVTSSKPQAEMKPPSRLPPAGPPAAATEQAKVTVDKPQSNADVAKLNTRLEELEGINEELREQARQDLAMLEARAEEWKRRYTNSEETLTSTRAEYSRLLDEAKAEAARVKKEFDEREHKHEAEVTELKAKIQELQDALLAEKSSASDKMKESSIWAEAERVLALSRLDVEQAGKQRDLAVSQACAKEKEASDAIQRCEELLVAANARVKVLEEELSHYKQARTSRVSS